MRLLRKLFNSKHKDNLTTKEEKQEVLSRQETLLLRIRFLELQKQNIGRKWNTPPTG